MTNVKPCQEAAAIVLPSLNPDEKFTKVVAGLVDKGFQHIVIVDDGSDEDHQPFFAQAERYPQCTVLHHGVNKGKGRALKTAFAHVLQQMPEIQGVITIDGDGQHLVEDIIACGDRMLQEGDKTTSRLFRLIYGIRLSDTQTGLRAIPQQYLGRFCAIEGERFEYETNMLLQMKRQGISFLEQAIATVYDPDDYSSHYNALKDSWRIFKIMVKNKVR